MASRRRANNEGSIYRRSDGRWAAAFSTGDGRRKTVYGRTRADAARKLAEVQRAHQDGLLPGDGRLTVAAFARDWLSGVRPSVRPKTAEGYGWAVEKHIVPAVGRLRVAKVQPLHLERLYADMRSAGKAPKTIRSVHGVAHTMFEKAVRLGLVVRNPVALADVPKVPRREPPLFDRSDLRAFLAEASGHRLEALFTLAITTGARSGELLGLRWSDADLDRGEVHIRVALQLTRDGFALVEPKTRTSVRTLGLTRLAVDALRRHRVRQNEEALALGPAWSNVWDLVFVSEVGSPLDRHNVLKRDLRPLLIRANLPPFTFHQLRHLAGSLALDHGVPLPAVSQALGHSDMSTTARIYAHLIRGSERKVAVAFDAMAAGL